MESHLPGCNSSSVPNAAHIIAPPAGQKVCNLLRNASRSAALLLQFITASGSKLRLRNAVSLSSSLTTHTNARAYVLDGIAHRTVQETDRTGCVELFTLFHVGLGVVLPGEYDDYDDYDDNDNDD